MVVNGSKSGEKPLLPFFFELWSNNKNTTEKHKLLCIFRRFYLFRARSLFVVEHVLGKEQTAVKRGSRTPSKIGEKLNMLLWLSR